MTNISSSYRKNFGAGLLSELNDIKNQPSNPSLKTTETESKAKKSFLDHIHEGVEEVNVMQKKADVMATDLASGKSKNIHETMLAATHAELSFNLMVAIRNKVLESYQEVMRMQV